MSITIGDLIERTYRTYLYPPDYEPAMVQLDGAIDDTVVAMTLGEFVVPEDEELLRVGALIEANQELMRVTDYVSTTRVATMVRGVRGTTKAAHADELFMVLTPAYPRLSVFEAVRDNIISLSPQLYTTDVDNLVMVGANVAPIDDELAISIISIWADNLADTVDWHGQIVDYHPLTAGRAVITNVPMGSIWIRYRKRMGVALTEADTLETLGVESVWEVAVMLGVAADLLVGRDVPQTQAEYIGSILQAENIRPGTRTSIAGALSQYRDILIKRFSREMNNEYRKKARMRDPFGSRSESWVG